MNQFTYNSLFCKLRRRWRTPPFVGGIGLVYLAAMLVSMVAWLTPVGHGPALAVAARWMWCVMAGIGALLQGVVLLLAPVFPYAPSAPELRWTRSFRGLAGWSATMGTGAAAVALGCGRVDLAVLLELYPESFFKGCWGAQARAWWILPGVALHLLVLLAFDLRSPWLVAIGMLLGLAVRPFFKPSLREGLAEKLTRAQYLR